jgi:two-component system NtrC family sensor kinase
MKLARKLALFLVLGMCAVLAIDDFFGIRREVNVYEADTRSDEHLTGRALATAIAELWPAGGRQRVLDVIRRANADATQLRIRWVEFDAQPGDALAPALPREELDAVTRGGEFHTAVTTGSNRGRFFTYVPVNIDGKFVGAIELSETFVENERHVAAIVLNRIVTTGVLVVLSGLLAGILGAVFVGDPIRKLVDKARRVGAGDLSTPLELRQRDELGELGREIDLMCDNLAAARKRIDAETAARITAIDQLRHADRLATVGKLASGVAHELGTPLNVVAQRAKMIATGEVQGGDARDGARIIVEQSQRMAGVIRQLLGFARRHRPHKERHDLGRIAREVTTLLAPLATRRGVSIRIDGPSEPLHAQVDAGQIHQALANLVVNGIHAMERGGELRLVLGSRDALPPAGHGGAPGRYSCITVEDHGSGIAPEHRAHLFEPFFTTKDVGEGTGLGLAVAYGIVGEHGGWIEVDSEPGTGSRFSVFLPGIAPPGETPRVDVTEGPAAHAPVAHV